MTAKTVSKTDSKFNVKLIAITAMCAALVTVTTAFIKIPSPLGYSHAGDSMIYLAASILPGPFGIIASSIGGALADLISGYPHWAIPTAIIKAVNAVPFVLCRMAMKKCGKDEKSSVRHHFLCSFRQQSLQSAVTLLQTVLCMTLVPQLQIFRHVGYSPV